MSKGFRNITGTFDILPDSQTVDGTTIPAVQIWVETEQKIREVMSLYGFQEIRTPVLEPTELIARGVGQDTDLVSKEMFAFERGNTRYVMRPEVTAPVMRSYLQHHLDQKGGVQKLYYIGPCFRAERPQKGRYRQFHQFGVELIGAEGAFADVEAISVMMDVYQKMGVRDTTLRLNSLGYEESRPRYRKALIEYFEPLKEELSETSRARLKTNPLRILDTKSEKERALLTNAPRLTEFLDSSSKAHFSLVKEMLGDLGILFVEDPFLVRGLDYYSHTTFELESPALGAQSALAGGGRYDLLAKAIGHKQKVPAIGFAAGFERLFLALQASGKKMDVQQHTKVYVVAIGDEAQRWAQTTAARWRSAGHSVTFDLKGRSMKAQMREANRLNAETVLIIGSDELSSGSAVVRQMESGEQQNVLLTSIDSVVAT